MRSALRIGVPEVIKRLEVRSKPRHSLVECLDALAGLVAPDQEMIEPLKLK